MRYLQQSDFFSVIQKQETTKTFNNNFFASPGKLNGIAKGVTASVALIINT